MPEELKSISDARQKLPKLSESANKQFGRYIITNQGQPQSVLIGYNEYRSLKAATQILQQRDVLEDIRTGLRELKEGRGLSLDDVAARLQAGSKPKRSADFTDAVAKMAGVDMKTVAMVLKSCADVMKGTSEGPFDIPGLGVVTIPERARKKRGPSKAPRRARTDRLAT